MGSALALAFLFGVCVLWFVARARWYVRRTRAGRWAYGRHDRYTRIHFGTRATLAEALQRVDELSKRASAR